MDIAGNERVIGTDEVEVVVVDELLRYLDEGDVAGWTAVVPPIGLESGHTVGDAGIVDREDDEVPAILEDVGDLAVERSVAAFMLADLFCVDPDESAVVGGA